MRTFVLLLTLVEALAAQSRVSGVVKDATGAPIAGVQVRLAGVERVTSDDGRFVFEDVVCGSYTLTASALGFGRWETPLTVIEDSDVGDVVFRIWDHSGPTIVLGPETDCWDTAGNPALAMTRLPTLAVSAPLPPQQPIEGVVRVKVLAVASGVVACAAAISGDARLARESLLAARQWRFRPGTPFTGYLDFRFSTRGNSVK